MATHRSLVSLASKRKILGIHYFVMALQSVQASAQNGTATGFFWLQLVVGATVQARLRKVRMEFSHIATETDHLTAPRILLARCTFTGTASGTSVTVDVRKSTDTAAVAVLRTAVTGMTVTVGNGFWNAIAPPFALTTSGIAAYAPVPNLFDPKDEDEFFDIAAGQLVLCYQPDAGTTTDGRRFSVDGCWDEYTPADATASSVTLPDDATNTGKSSATILEA